MARLSASAALSILSLFAARSAAWGQLGHDTVGFIAQNFVSDETKSWAQKILANDSDAYLGGVGTWADSFKYTDEGAWSSSLHYIDAEDDPPDSCGVEFERDCPEEGCVVSAIANFTERVQDASLDEEQVSQALKFLVHFLGDIHQPLHDEAAEIGGNTINVTFNGEDTNLHSVWDSAMPEELIGGYEDSFAKSWALNLTSSVKSGKFKGQADSWLQGMDVKDAQGSAMTWANDANGWICKTVLADGIEGVEGIEILPAYYRKSIPVIELMVAKAGYRLAAWLNLIATGSTGGLKVAEGAPLKARNILTEDLRAPELPGGQGGVLSEARIKRLAFGPDCNCGHKH